MKDNNRYETKLYSVEVRLEIERVLYNNCVFRYYLNMNEGYLLKYVF